METTTQLVGAWLLHDLKSDDGMTEEEARSWVQARTNRPFDPDVMYGLGWPPDERSKTWGGCANLRVWIMTDYGGKKARRSGE